MWSIGIVPFVGDVADVFWKSNARNFALLEHHAGTDRPARPGDWLFVAAVHRARSSSLPLLPIVAVGVARLRMVGAVMTSRVFLLSPANCGGTRARQVLSPRAAFALAAAAAIGRRGAARRALRVRQRAVLPRQADLRAPVRGAARARQRDDRQRRPHHHAERRPARARTCWSPPPTCGRSPERTCIPNNPLFTGAARAQRARAAPGARPRLRRRPARQHRLAQVRRRPASRSSATGCGFRSTSSAAAT